MSEQSNFRRNYGPPHHAGPATVAEFGDYSRQCGQGFSLGSCLCLRVIRPTLCDRQ